MIGAVVGDMIGSNYEFWPTKKKDFEWWGSRSRFTDDSILTIATADALLNNKSYEEVYAYWGSKYPEGGYGARFAKWLGTKDKKPYNSFGNGSAMRVSPVAYWFDNLEDVLKEAEKTALPTHDHPEGIKGAQATAGAVFLALQKESKKEIKKFVEDRFDYDLDRTCDDIRPDYKFDVTCQGSVPESIIAFLDSTSYEDTIRNAVSLGGDADTQACIAGSIAQPFYQEMPFDWVVRASEVLPEEMKQVLNQFNDFYTEKFGEK